uniref:Uncharacterized protein n=1 Tax=Gopherus agassizii TaxID=38772 RepID=A0A452J3E8_9SAUR
NDHKIFLLLLGLYFLWRGSGGPPADVPAEGRSRPQHTKRVLGAACRRRCSASCQEGCRRLQWTSRRRACGGSDGLAASVEQPQARLQEVHRSSMTGDRWTSMHGALTFPA